MAARCSWTKPASDREMLRRAWSKRARLNWPSDPWKAGFSMMERAMVWSETLSPSFLASSAITASVTRSETTRWARPAGPARPEAGRAGLVRDAPPGLPRLLGHHRLGDEVGDDPLVEAGGPGLLGRDDR